MLKMNLEDDIVEISLEMESPPSAFRDHRLQACGPSHNRHADRVHDAGGTGGDRAGGIDTVTITGTATNICCESTAGDAMMLSYKVLFA